MAIEVYWGSGSSFSWRVLLALEVKGLPYESRLLQFSRREHKAPEYLALNPRGQVPTLRDGDLVVTESIAILAYLDRRYPASPLFGATPDEAAAVWQAVQQCVCYFDGPSDAFVLGMYFGVDDENERAVRAALPHIDAELGRMEATLASSPWLAGATLSAADLVTYPMVKSVLRAAGKPAAVELAARLTLPGPRRPALAAWMAAVEALPGYDRTYPPHWRS